MPVAIALRHLAFEDLGLFEPLLRGLGYDLRYCDAGIDDLDAAGAERADLLIVLGGPISANDIEDFPFLAATLSQLQRRLASRRPTMGICLGAQLIARALGGRVYRSRAPEIGFAPIQLTADGKQSCLAAYADQPMALHWHGETFDLPQHATRLAYTPDCDNQAFALGSNIIGFQFHPEADPDALERWLIGHSAELRRHGIAPGELRTLAARYRSGLESNARRVLTEWIAGLQ